MRPICPSAVCMAHRHLFRPEGEWAWLDWYAESHTTLELLRVDSPNARRDGQVLHQVRANSQLFLRDDIA